MPRIQVNDEKHWHELRAHHVGASETGALHGLDPYLTRYELWHRKVGSLPEEDLSNNELVFWGTILEPAVAQGVRQKTGWNIRKIRTYWTSDSVPGMGASLDYEIVDHPNGPGVLQIKTTDRMAFRDWPDGAPPMRYELQVQHEIAVTGRKWGALGVLVGGNSLQIYERDRHDKAIESIERGVREFWESVHAGKEPDPEYDRDLDTLSQLYGWIVDIPTVDLSQDNQAVELCASYKQASAAKSAADKAQKAAKAELIHKIAKAHGDEDFVKSNDPAIATIGDFKISMSEVGAKDIAYTRKPYRTFNVNEKKAKKEAA